MSQTKNAVDLYALLIRDTFGEFSSRIFTQLLHRGRQAIPTLVHDTSLTPRQIRHGLAVLIQQNLIYHHLDQDSNTTFYEANHELAHFFLRTGRVLEIIQSRYGLVARTVVQKLLLLGHAKICDLTATFESQAKASNIATEQGSNGTAHPNGDSHRDTGKDEMANGIELEDSIMQLLEAGILEPVHGNMFRSPSDTYHSIERQIIKEKYKGTIKGPKDKEELRQDTIDRLRELRAERGWHGQKSLKRQANGVHTNGAKRRKLVNGDVKINGDTNDHNRENSLDSHLVLRVNHEKCAVALRTQQMVALAKHDIGEATSNVYAEILRLLEEKISGCRPDPLLDNNGDDDMEKLYVSTLELNMTLSKSLNLSWGIGKADESMINTKMLEKPQRKQTRVNDDTEAVVEGDPSSDEISEEDGSDVDEQGNIMEVDADSDSHGEESFTTTTSITRTRPAKVTFKTKPTIFEHPHDRLAQLRKHLLLLTEHPHHLLRRCGSRGLGEYTIDFEEVVKYMKETTLDAYISQTFGRTGRLIARILRRNGKLDEKQIQKLGMLKQKEVRTKLVEMQMAGFVDIQEVPKDSSRTTGRTIFLWYFDLERVTALVLEMTHKSIVRCFQVIEAERFRESAVMAVVSRTDIQGRETEILTDEALSRYQRLIGKEEKLLTQISRLDEVVGVLRDF